MPTPIFVAELEGISMSHQTRSRMRMSTAHTLISIYALALCAIIATPLSAQNGAARTIIAVFENYPVFEPRPAGGARATSELRAIVVPRDFADKEQSVVILNPAHVTPEVLYAALVGLSTWSTGQQQAKLIGVTQRGTPAVGALSEPMRSALSATIAELLAARPSMVRGHQRGKQIVLSTEVQRVVTEASAHSPP